MKIAIHKDGVEGFVTFKPEGKELMVTHPDEQVRNRVRKYLTTERPFTIPGRNLGQKCDEYHTATEDPNYMDMALCEMKHRTGVQVNWYHPDNEGWHYKPNTSPEEDRVVIKSIDDDEEYLIIN